MGGLEGKEGIEGAEGAENKCYDDFIWPGLDINN